jgi:hypothetical protein
MIMLGAAPSRVAGQAATAALTGTVRDSAGAPVAKAELILSQGATELRRIIADNRGHFVIGDVAPGAYLVWIRRLGFRSAEYNWAAGANQRDTIVVTLRVIPHGLSPVVVRASEERNRKGSAQLLGIVVDTTGNPLSEANVALVGADREGETLENGGFLFRPLPVGPYVVRVRKLGFVPQSVTLDLRDGDEREVVIRLHPIVSTLATVNIVAASGFDLRDEQVLKALDARLRWRSVRDVVMGPAELRWYMGRSLDLVHRAVGMAMRADFRRSVPTSINPVGTSGGRSEGRFGVAQSVTVKDDACIVENGSRFVRQPLRSYDASEIELLEIYDEYGDDTRSLDAYMVGSCARGAGGRHPFWYVVWLKGRDR